MTIQPAPDKNTPAKLNHKSVMCKEFGKTVKSVKNKVSDNYTTHTLWILQFYSQVTDNP
jgi:hypothetical protein